MATSNKQRTCVYEGCTLCGSFRVPDEFGFYCSKHAPENAVDVSRSMCETESCTHHATFGTTRAVSCKTHSCAGMVNLRSMICHDCDKLASYNFAGKTRGKFCVIHAEKSMVSVLGKRCPCGIRASFGLTKKGPVMFCKTCKPSNAVLVDKRICIHPDGCTTRATYGPVGEKPIYCADHKVEGMMIDPWSKCADCGKELPCGDDGGQTVYL